MSEDPNATDDEPRPTAYRLRRAPKYLPFGVAGALLGVVVGIVLALSFPINGDYSERAIIGYFASILGLVGALAGLGTAVLIERRQNRPPSSGRPGSRRSPV